MAKWQPPIPSGALWSQEVIQSNAGALLAYCYDAVLTDGTFTIQLAEACGDMGVEYRTIKRWWSALRAGSFFKSVQDKGRKGFLVRMSDDWLDWRILKARQTVQVEGPKISPEIESEGISVSPDDTQVVLKGISRTDERPSMSLENNVYKVLITTDQNNDPRPVSDDTVTSPPADGDRGDSTPRPNRPPKRQSAAPEIPPAPLAIRQVIATGSQIDLKTSTQASIIQVNKAAKAIWYKCRKPEWDEAETVKRIRWAGRWVRQTQYPYSEKAEQRISPSKLVDLFTAAMEAYEKAQAKPAHLNGTNGQHTPAPLISIQDAAKRAAEYAKQYDPFNERGGT